MDEGSRAHGSLSERDILRLERPEPSLLTYYVLSSLLAGPAFFAPLLYYTFRYRTLRYRFDEEGVSMRWGILFRREIHLTYSRIQDIHLVSNAVERWLGIGRIEIQTASGSAKAEMTIEGIGALEALRDFLYARMRGARPGGARAAAGRPLRATLTDESAAALAETLRHVAEEIRGLRRELVARRAGAGADSDA